MRNVFFSSIGSCLIHCDQQLNPTHRFFSFLDFVVFQVVTLRLILIPWFRTGNVVSFRLWWETGVAGDVGKLSRRRENTPNYTNSGTCFLLWLLHLTVTGRDWYNMIFICVGVILCWQESRWSHTLQYKVSSQRLAVVTLPWGRFAWSANWRLFDVTCLAHASSGFTASNQQKSVI